MSVWTIIRQITDVYEVSNKIPIITYVFKPNHRINDWKYEDYF